MSGVTIKVSQTTRARVKRLADRSKQTMQAVLVDALNQYEKSLAQAEYLRGWARFVEEDPQGFAAYLKESEEIEQGLTDAVHE